MNNNGDVPVVDPFHFEVVVVCIPSSLVDPNDANEGMSYLEPIVKGFRSFAN